MSRRSRFLPKDSQESLSALCRKHSQPYWRVQERLEEGWSLEEALGVTPHIYNPLAEKPPPVDYGPDAPYTESGLNILSVMAGELTGEEYLQKEGVPPGPPGTELGVRSRKKYTRRRKIRLPGTSQ